MSKFPRFFAALRMTIINEHGFKRSVRDPKNVCPGFVPLFSVLALLLLPLASRAAEDTGLAPTPAEMALVRQAEAARVEAIHRVAGSVVSIFGMNRQGGGSGVVIDPSGLTLTNHHVVAAAGETGWGGLADGNLYRWELVGTDPGGDVAVIQLSGQKRFPYAPLADSDRVCVGDFAMAMGNPFVLAEDYTPTVTLGIVSGVKRYQYGQGNNTLVYGNCIQVDSSINPGNSGGPLFNMSGGVIGINGRGSFLERGRVNVGLGYAISMRQIVNFIPDLVATKTAQHGTLDAQFGNRSDGVICVAINLDSAAAAAGLRLGDRLIEFEAQPIDDANQLTSLISTLPAEWPAHAVCERDGERFEFTLRLVPLPYGKLGPSREAEPPSPEDKKEEGENSRGPAEQSQGQSEAPNSPEEPDNQAPKEKPKGPPDAPRILRVRPRLKLGEPGEIRDAKRNEAVCQWLLDCWLADTRIGGLPQPGTAFRVKGVLATSDREVGWQELLLAADGRFRLDSVQFGRSRSCGFDGNGFWRMEGSEAPERIEPDDLLDDPIGGWALITSTLFLCLPSLESDYAEPAPRKAISQHLGTCRLDGSDKAKGHPAYRLRWTDGSGREFFTWLSVVGDDYRMQVRLLKSSRGKDGRRRAVTYVGHTRNAGFALPVPTQVVEGLPEREVLRFVDANVEEVKQPAAGLWQMPPETE